MMEWKRSFWVGLVHEEHPREQVLWSSKFKLCPNNMTLMQSSMGANIPVIVGM
jgi:hypothetical protein